MSSAQPTPVPLNVNGVALAADASGALIWPEQRTVVVADLHFEKGTSFARHGTMLPPYDTRASLERLAAVIERHQATRVICLGDSFHDGEAGERIDAQDAARLAGLIAAHDWTWITGNHDPVPPAGLGGTIVSQITLGALVFRHQAAPASSRAVGEISGHFHPTATVKLRAGRTVGRCFVGDERRLILPAFGAFAGGLDVFDPAIGGLFPDGFAVHLARGDRVITIARSHLVPSAYARLATLG